jgi:SAM-dependent methyltransferase
MVVRAGLYEATREGAMSKLLGARYGHRDTPRKQLHMPIVPSDHRFDDPAYVRAWTEGINERRPIRLVVFEQVAEVLSTQRPPVSSVLELGAGPGMLAEHLLQRVEAIERYTLFDFSEPMHELARQRLVSYADRTVHIVGSFLDDGWANTLSRPFGAIVSMQAIHELRDATLIPALYREVHRLLTPSGVFVFADLINRDGDHQDHRLTPDEHVVALSAAGFDRAEVLAVHDDLALVRGDLREPSPRRSNDTP